MRSEYAQITAPLHKLIANNEFVWGETEEAAFQECKQRLCEAPILAFPNFDQSAEPFILDVDASGEAVGGVLSQRQDGKERVIAYGSKALSRTQKNYGTTQREMLAVFLFLEQFCQYLIVKRFILRTDHQPLTALQSIKPSAMLHRWHMRLPNLILTRIHG